MFLLGLIFVGFSGSFSHLLVEFLDDVLFYYVFIAGAEGLLVVQPVLGQRC